MQGVLLVSGVLTVLVLGAAIARNPVRGLYVAIFASAVLITPELPVVRDKIAACEVVMVITWLVAACRALPGKRWLVSQKKAFVRALLFLAIALISFAGNAATGNLDFSHSGVEMANYVYGFLVFTTVVCLVQSWDQWLRCLIAWAWGTVLVSAVAMVTILGWGPSWAQDSFSGRVSSTLKFSNQLPGYCIPILILVIVTAALRQAPRRIRMPAVLLAGAIGLAVIASGSRSGLLLLGGSIAAVIGIAISERRNPALDRAILTGLGMAAALAVVLFVVRVAATSDQGYALGRTPGYQRAARMGTLWMQGDEGAEDTRIIQLRLAAEKIPEQLALGVGPANFAMVFHVDEIHNTYVGVLVEEGIFGAMALVVWLASVIENARLGLKWSPSGMHRLIVLAILTGFLALLVYGVTMFGLRQRPFWFMAGLLVALPRVMYNWSAMRAWRYDSCAVVTA